MNSLHVISTVGRNLVSVKIRIFYVQVFLALLEMTSNQYIPSVTRSQTDEA